MTDDPGRCPHCGGPMTPGGTAIACADGGRSLTVPLPAYCASSRCADARDTAAIDRAIAAGIIDP